jgi:RNA polymerase sigma factor (sigma-70 family)
MDLTRAEENKIVSEHFDFVRSRAKRYVGHGIDLDDLVQEGCIGLLAAARNWRVDGGASLKTYAQQWIDQYIRRAIGTDRKGKLRPEPKAASLDKQRKIGNGDGVETLHDILPDDAPNPEEIATKAEQAERVNSALRTLTDRERAVLEGRFVNDLSLDEVGVTIGRGRRRVHQIQTEALERVGKALRRA